VEFSALEGEILVNAWALAHDGRGQVVEPWALPEAVRLSEAGWLERRMLPNGHASWWWTEQAETALDLNALKQSVEGRHN